MRFALASTGLEIEPGCLSGKLDATLAATSAEDRAAGTRTHAQTETVHLVATTVVRLVGPLAHGDLFRSGTGRSRWSAGLSARVPRRAPSGCTTQPLTDQRYAVASSRVKPALPARRRPARGRPTAPVHHADSLWRTACARYSHGVKFAPTEVPYRPPGRVSDRRFPTASTRLGPALAMPGAQPVDKLVDSGVCHRRSERWTATPEAQ